MADPPLLFLSKGSTLATGFFNATDAGGGSVDCVEVADDWLPRCRLGMKLGAKGDGVGRAGPAASATGAGVAIGCTMLLDGGVEPLDEEDELNRLAQDLAAGAAAAVVAGGGGAYGVGTMIGP